MSAVSLKCFANTKCQQERPKPYFGLSCQNHILAINGVLPDAFVVLFAGNPSVFSKLKLISLHHLQKAFHNNRLMTCFAEYARYQQLRDMPVHTDSTLCTLEKLIHRCVCLSVLMCVYPAVCFPSSNAEKCTLQGVE
ncbi:TPA: hypothetical protein ACH3X1_004902 [Trebouxia sp. C0004]